MNQVMHKHVFGENTILLLFTLSLLVDLSTNLYIILIKCLLKYKNLTFCVTRILHLRCFHFKHTQFVVPLQIFNAVLDVVVFVMIETQVHLKTACSIATVTLVQAYS